MPVAVASAPNFTCMHVKNACIANKRFIGLKGSENSTPIPKASVRPNDT